MKKTAKKARGRPKVANPKSLQINVRIDPSLREAIEKYRTKYQDTAGLNELSDAVRHILKRVLKDEDLLK
jgi:hypothetical protein